MVGQKKKKKNPGMNCDGKKVPSLDMYSSRSVIKVQPHQMEQVVTETAKLDTPRGTGCLFRAGVTVSQSCGLVREAGENCLS